MLERVRSAAALGVKPLVTFALFSFNQENFIRAAVEGALAQDYSPLEIIISDDFSTDKTVEIISEVIDGYCGPHKIVFNVNEYNMGLIGHINKIFEMASGELIVAAAGDDISLSKRTSLLADIYFDSKPMLIHSSVTRIDESGNELGVFRLDFDLNEMSIQEMTISLSLYIGATAAWSKSLYSKYGPVVFFNAYEDLIFGYRALLSKAIEFIDEPLVMYRVGTGLSTKKYDFKKGFLSIYYLRRRNILVNIDVYSQRLRDLNFVGDDFGVSALRSVLAKRIFLQKNKLFVYENKMNLFINLFNKDFYLVFIAVFGEIIYSITAMKEYFFWGVKSLFK